MTFPAKLTAAVLLIAAGSVAGGLLGWHLYPALKLEPRVPVPDQALEQSRPTPPTSLGQKLTHATVPPAQIATSEGRPGAAAVLNYCRPALPALASTWMHGGHDSLPTPVAAPDSVLPVEVARAVLPPFSGRLSGRKLELYSTLSDGRLWRGTWTHVHQPVEWGSDGDSVWLEQERFWVRAGRGGVTCVKRAPIGALLGLALGVLAKRPALGAEVGAAASCMDGLLEEVP